MSLLYIFFGGIQAKAALGGPPGGVSINFVESNGSTTTQRNVLNLIGSSVTCVDNSTFKRIDCTVGGGGGGGFNVIGTPSTNDEIVWDGSNPHWTAEGVSYAFSIASFSDGQAGTIEIGNGVWKTAGNISFTASYSNGPATGGYVSFGGWANLTLTNTFQGPTVTLAGTNFPAVGGTVIFTLNATNGTSSPTSSIVHTFTNDRYWGITSIASSVYASTDITSGLGNNDLANSIPKTFTVNPGAGQYIVYAYPSRLGTATFSVGGFAGGFLPAVSVSVTNASSYVETFSVYRSVNSNLGSTTVVVTTP